MSRIILRNKEMPMLVCMYIVGYKITTLSALAIPALNAVNLPKVVLKGQALYGLA